VDRTSPPSNGLALLLERVPAVRELPRGAVEVLGGACRDAEFRSGDRIVPLFRAHPRLVFLLDGLARLSGISPNGVERIMYVYRPGDIVGSRFLQDTPEDGHEVIAMTKIRALTLEQSEFLRIGERHPEVLLAVTREFTLRLERVTSRYLGNMTSEVPVRLARLLLDFGGNGDGDGRHATDGFVPLAHPITHQTMAQIVGASRPHVSSTLGQLEAAGALRRIPPRGLEVNPARLHEISEAGEFEPPE
jgi:CRP-like cAMP-binding protein